MGPILSTANKTPNKAHIDPNLFSMSSPSLGCDFVRLQQQKPIASPPYILLAISPFSSGFCFSLNDQNSDRPIAVAMYLLYLTLFYVGT